MEKEEYQYILRVLRRFLGLNTEPENLSKAYLYNWESILYQAILHKITGILYIDLINTGVYKIVNNNLFRYLKRNCDYSNAINLKMLDYSEKISNELMGEIDIAIIKGAILTGYLYNDFSLRTFNDIDILVEKKNIDIVSKYLRDLGCVQGKYDKKRRTVVKANRSEIVMKELNSHETVEFHLLSRELFDFDIVFDINFAFFWKGLKYLENINISDVLDKTRKYIIKERVVSSLSPENLFIHTCLHLYTEAVLFCWQYSWYKNFEETELNKYIDVALFLSKDMDFVYIDKIIQKHNLFEPVSFVLTHCKEIFDDLNIPCLMEKYILNNMKDFYYTCNEEKKYWKSTFCDRLFNQRLRYMEISQMKQKNEFKF